MTVGIASRPTRGGPPHSVVTTTESCVIVSVGLCIGNGVDKNPDALVTMTAREARAYAKMLEAAANAVEQQEE
jgi:hypothetical protein